MMVYGSVNMEGTANQILGSSLEPVNRCINKRVALDSNASAEELAEWEAKQAYTNTIPFDDRRLIPVKAVVHSDSYNPFAELHDDDIMEMQWDRNTNARSYQTTPRKRDIFMAGYKYEITSIKIGNSTTSPIPTNETYNPTTNPEYDEYGNVVEQTYEITSTGDAKLGGNCKMYQKDWLKVWLRDPDMQLSNYTDYYIDQDTGYYYVHTIACLDTEGDNYGEDKFATLTIHATRLDQQTLNAQGIVCVPEDKTHTDFQIIVCHRGNGQQTEVWSTYDINNTSNVTLTHTAPQGQTIDIVATLEGASTNGTYWDSTGWIHSSAQSSVLENAISVSKSQNVSSVSIDWALIKQVADSDDSAAEFPIRIWACWDKMTASNSTDKHLEANSNGQITMTATGLSGSKSLTVKSAGNLNKIAQADSVNRYYTCLYKITWKNTEGNIKLMPLESTDESLLSIQNNIGGTYGLIYPVNSSSDPTLSIVRDENKSDKDRDYVAGSSVVSNNQASITLQSTINGSPASYVIKQYFLDGSMPLQETYTINGQSLTKDGSITITPSGTTSTLNIDFGNISAGGSVRRLTFQQVDSREFANISFTFND